MKTSQFEAVKVAIKQDKNGYILTLCIHPDEIPDEILRDFVGSTYQVVMVRLSDHQPMNRERELRDPVRAAAILCKDKLFAKFLVDTGNIFEETEAKAVDWLKSYLDIKSRATLKDNPEAAKQLYRIEQEFISWKNASYHTPSI